MPAYEQIIGRIDRSMLEKALRMESGYVLHFSDKTFGDFFCTEVGIDPDDPKNAALFSAYGTSKARRLRSFIANAPDHLVAKALRALWEARENNAMGFGYDWGLGSNDSSKDADLEESRIREAYFRVVAQFEGDERAIDHSGIEAFEEKETLKELVEAIRRDIEANRPQAGLDRLHTFCMKRFASLVVKHGGEPCGENDALHARVGKYLRALKAQRNLSEMTERIIKSSISTFEAMNDIRNNRSLAHDNEHLVPMEEAKLIFDNVTAVLRFIKTVDAQRFDG